MEFDLVFCFFFQAEDGIRDHCVTGVQTCALPIFIEKLPFASPEDPLVRARIEHLTASGGNAFRDYQLPEAALALKQGAGRLIRSEEDYGVVVVCDPRLVGRAYGRVFLEALPAMSVTQDAGEALRFLRRHARRAPGGARAAVAP